MRACGTVTAVPVPVPGRALIDYGRLLDAMGIEAELLVTAAHGARSSALVPGCPGLTLGETVRHVGSVYRLVDTWIGGEDPQRRSTGWQPEPEQGQSAEDYLRAGLAELLPSLRDAPPDSECSTWWPEDTSFGFWRRRMAHETTVHRIDVQGAAGREVGPVPTDIAVDGIDEVLTLWFERRLAMLGVTGTRAARVSVCSGGREWLVSSGPDGGHTERVEPGSSEADAVVAGEPQQTYLWLWGRVPHHAVSTGGDEDAVAQLWALLRLATR